MEEQESLMRTDKRQETVFGRFRRYAEISEDAKRQAYNFPIQSPASDLTLISLIRIKEALARLQLNAKPRLTVYDSIVLSVDNNVLWEVAMLTQHIMENMEFSWITVPIKVDLKAGFTWGSMKKLNIEQRIIG
jgi:DNA polymerase I-like protein with 3'-5' exonuclease and polymerase domains